MDTPPFPLTPPSHIANVSQPTSISNVLIHVAPTILTLPKSMVLKGTVAGKDAKGNILINTEYGNLTLNKYLQFKTGESLTFEIKTGSGATQLKLLKVNGKPPELIHLPKIPHQIDGNKPTDIFRVAPGITHSMTQPLATAATTSKTHTTTPTANHPTTAKPATTVNLHTIPIGKTLTATLLALTKNALQHPAITALAPPSLVKASTLSVTPHFIQLPHTPPPSTNSLPPHTALLTATVLNHQADTEGVVKTQIGTLNIPEVRSLPPDTQLYLAINQITPPTTTLPPLPTTPVETAARLLHYWQSLEMIIHTTHQSDPFTAKQFIENQIPSLKSPVITRILQFIHTVQQGDARGFLTEPIVQQLEVNGHKELLTRFALEFRHLQQLFNEPASLPQHHTAQQPTIWHTIFIPFYHAGQLTPMQLYISDHDDSEIAKLASGKRFILELTLSNIGPIQLEGFVRSRPVSSLLDIIVKTPHALPQSLQTELQHLYSTINEATGNKGKITFQMESPFHENPGQSFIHHTPPIII